MNESAQQCMVSLVQLTARLFVISRAVRNRVLMYQPSTARVPSVTTVDAAAIPPSLTDYPVPFHHPPISSISSDLPGRCWVFFMYVLTAVLIYGVGRNWKNLLTLWFWLFFLMEQVYMQYGTDVMSRQASYRLSAHFQIAFCSSDVKSTAFGVQTGT